MEKDAMNFVYSQSEEPHIQRTKDIIKAHPEIKQLMGRYPKSFLWAFAIVAAQIFRQSKFCRSLS